ALRGLELSRRVQWMLSKLTGGAVKISKRWPIIPLSAGILIGYLLSTGRAPQRVVRLFETVVEHVSPPNTALATSAPSAALQADPPPDGSFRVMRSHPHF